MRHRPSTALVIQAAALVAVLLPWASAAQSPSFTFGPANYFPPATGSAGSTSTNIIRGNQTQPTGAAIPTALKFPSSSLQQYPGVTFAGNGGCSPHSNNDYLALRTFVVPTLEVEVPAVRWYRQTADGSDSSPSSVTYLDLPGGNLVVGARQFNFSQQASYFSYSLITPNLVDLPAYKVALQQLTQVVQGLATGFPPWQAATPCNSPIPALQGLLAYLQGIQGQLNDSSGAAVGGGLRPTEVNLSAGCVEEIDANYKGALLSDVLGNVKSGDDCCAQCRGQAGCNVWVWCPLTSGCSTGNGTFPYLGCQLKYQANLSSSALPDAWERGPPTAFVSGRVISS